MSAVDPQQETIKGGDPTVVINNESPEPLDALGPLLVSVVKESKEGYKTTEFWLTAVLVLLTVLDVIPLPESYEAYVAGALGVAYTLSRGLAKKGVPVVEPSPAAIAPAALEEEL